MKLSNLIIYSFIILGLIGSIVGGYYYYYISQDLIIDEVSNGLLAISESRAEHIETYLGQNIERIKLITSKTQLRIELEKYNNDQNQESLDKINTIIMDSKKSSMSSFLRKFNFKLLFFAYFSSSILS